MKWRQIIANNQANWSPSAGGQNAGGGGGDTQSAKQIENDPTAKHVSTSASQSVPNQNWMFTVPRGQSLKWSAVDDNEYCTVSHSSCNKHGGSTSWWRRWRSVSFSASIILFTCVMIDEVLPFKVKLNRGRGGRRRREKKKKKKGSEELIPLKAGLPNGLPHFQSLYAVEWPPPTEPLTRLAPPPHPCGLSGPSENTGEAPCCAFDGAQEGVWGALTRSHRSPCTRAPERADLLRVTHGAAQIRSDSYRAGGAL